MSAATNATIAELIKPKLDGKIADTLWLMLCGFLVFLMQLGFALLEAGTVRAKNTKNILMKNLLDACVGALVWWSIGYYIAVSTRLHTRARLLVCRRAIRRGRSWPGREIDSALAPPGARALGPRAS